MRSQIIYNNRVPLEDDTPLTDKLIIHSLLSDCGGSSLVYIAKQGAISYVVKETFPIRSAVPIRRHNNGCAIVADETLKGKAAQKEISECFDHELKISEMAHSCGNTNSIFTPCPSNITEEVKKTKGFENTIAQYMMLGTVSGKTLAEIQKLKPIDLKQALLYTKYILTSLGKSMHDKLLVHLDIKPDNIFISDEASFAIILDCGSAIELDKVAETTIFSFSEGFAPREIQLLKKYSVDLINLEAAEKYRDCIGTHTDLYSVGAIAFQLITHISFSSVDWRTINETDNPQKKAELIRKEVAAALEKEYPYLIDRISSMLSRAMYFIKCEDPRKKIEENRYCEYTEFIEEIELILDVLECKGIHPEIVMAKSRENFPDFLEKAGVKFTGDPIQNNDLFIRDWFAAAEYND